MLGLKSSDRTTMWLDIKTYGLSLEKHYITLSYFIAHHSKKFLWNIKSHIIYKILGVSILKEYLEY